MEPQNPADDETSASATSPPYWQTEPLQTQFASRGAVRSDFSPRSPLIQLEDHTEEDSEQWRACWAKSAHIDDYVVVSGAAGIGSYVVFNCVVETVNGSLMTLRKRYSEFDKLRHNLKRTFPNSEAAMPKLPPKSVVSRFQPKFLERRREGLAYFLNCVLLNPEFSASPVLKEFIFS